MNDPPKNEDRELIDMLIAISVMSRYLARKLEMKRSETAHESDERPGNHPGRNDTDREDTDRMRRKPDQSSNNYANFARLKYDYRRKPRHKSGKSEYVPVCQPYGIPGRNSIQSSAARQKIRPLVFREACDYGPAVRVRFQLSVRISISD